MGDSIDTGFGDYLAKTGLARKSHQFEAVRWCAQREIEGSMAGPVRCRGGLVADEMGLGKTIEIIGTMVCNPRPHTLVVVPLALLQQWKVALTRGNAYQPLVYHGAAKTKLEPEEIEAAEVVLTTYGTLASAAEAADSQAKGVLHGHRWDRVVCDEAHHLRNRRTKTHRGVARINSDIRWLLTGTPIQNRKSDFYSLCAAMGIPQGYYLKPENLAPLARAFILKRTKKTVGLDLPRLSKHVQKVGWVSKDEARLAEDIHSLLAFSGIGKGRRPPDGPGANRLAPGVTSAAAFGRTSLPLLVRARQACVHPPLMREHLSRLQAAGIIERQDWLMSATQSSSKISAVLAQLTERMNNGARKLVFCHYRGEIDALIRGLEARNIRAASLDGRTPSARRQELLTPASASDQVDVLVLQIQTGCEGLNLQSFSEVYFVSPHWNPAVEDQAIARCHRMGQTRPVTVFRYMMEGFDPETRSVEAYTRHVQWNKRVLVAELEEARTSVQYAAPKHAADWELPG